MTAPEFDAAALPWSLETMRLINKLTPDIKGKAFDPDWFLLRNRLEEFERERVALRADLDKALEELALAKTDTVRLDFLARQVVRVRDSRRCGSKEFFRASPSFEEKTSNIRSQIDAALKDRQ